MIAYAEDRRHDEDRDHLVDLGADQDAVRRQVVDVIARDHRVARIDGDHVGDQQHPADDGDEPGGHDLAGIEVERAQRDEDEDVQHGRRLEIERRRLHVLQVEAPDEAEQQRHVDDDREVAHPFGQPLPVGEHQPQHGEREVRGQHPRHRLERGIGPEGLPGEEVDDREADHHGELDPGDEYLARFLLRPDACRDARREGHPPRPPGEADFPGERQRCVHGVFLRSTMWRRGRAPGAYVSRGRGRFAYGATRIWAG